MRKTVAVCREKNVVILEADKERCFVVLPRGMFNMKAAKAISATCPVVFLPSCVCSNLQPNYVLRSRTRCAETGRVPLQRITGFFEGF